MNEFTQCANKMFGLEPSGHKKDKKGVRCQVHACCMRRNCDSLTRLSQQTEQVAEMAKRCTSVTNSIIFAAMDALVKIHQDGLIATRSVTPM